MTHIKRFSELNEKFNFKEFALKISPLHRLSNYILKLIERKLDTKTPEEQLILIDKIIRFGGFGKSMASIAIWVSLILNIGNISDANLSKNSINLLILYFVIDSFWRFLEDNLEKKTSDVKALENRKRKIEVLLSDIESQLSKNSEIVQN